MLAERERLLRENAAIQARISLSKDDNAYLVADLPNRSLRLELQGVALASLPIDRVRLNKHAQRLLTTSEGNQLLQTPFVLGVDRWFELSPTLGAGDSTAAASKPDTTGARMEAIRTEPVTAILSYDRRLTLVLDGKPPQTRWQRLRERVSTWLRSWSAGTLPGILRRQSSDEIMVTLEMSPPDVRSLAPSLVDGTKLILIL